MTTTTHHDCDFCGDRITEGRSELDVVSGPLLSSRDTIDICLGCLGTLEDLLTRPRQASRPTGPSSAFARPPLAGRIAG